MSYKLQLIIGDTRTADGANSKVRQLLKILNKNLAQIQDHNIYIDFCEAKRGGKFYLAAVKARMSFPVLNDFALSKSIAGEQDILSYVENLCQCGGGQSAGMDDPESTFEEMYENTPEELQGTAYKDYMSSTMMNEDGSSWREHALYSAQNKRMKNGGKRGGKNGAHDPGQEFIVQEDDDRDAFSGYSKEDADKKMRKFMSRRAKYGMDSIGNDDDDDDDAGFDGPRQAHDFPEPKEAPRRKKRRPVGRPRIQRSAKSTKMQVAPENEEERLFSTYWGNREESNV